MWIYERKGDEIILGLHLLYGWVHDMDTRPGVLRTPNSGQHTTTTTTTSSLVSVVANACATRLLIFIAAVLQGAQEEDLVREKSVETVIRKNRRLLFAGVGAAVATARRATYQVGW